MNFQLKNKKLQNALVSMYGQKVIYNINAACRQFDFSKCYNNFQDMKITINLDLYQDDDQFEDSCCQIVLNARQFEKLQRIDAIQSLQQKYCDIWPRGAYVINHLFLTTGNGFEFGDDCIIDCTTNIEYSIDKNMLLYYLMQNNIMLYPVWYDGTCRAIDNIKNQQFKLTILQCYKIIIEYIENVYLNYCENQIDLYKHFTTNYVDNWDENGIIDQQYNFLLQSYNHYKLILPKFKQSINDRIEQIKNRGEICQL